MLTTGLQQQLVGKCVQRDGYTYPAVEWEGELLPEAYLHDSTCLPHQLPDYERLFPRLTACEELYGVPEHEDWLERKGLEEVRPDGGRAPRVRARGFYPKLLLALLLWGRASAFASL